MTGPGDAPPPDGGTEAARTPVTWIFLALCVAVSVPSFFVPELRDVLGGIAPRQYPWQPFTAALMHGWPGFPGPLHLALNAFLILEAGRPCERLLGSSRFLVLSLASLLANAVAVHVTPGVNGSSLVIWAWAPPLLVARRSGTLTGAGDPERIGGVLVLLFLVIPLAMTAAPYVAGWRGNPVVAFARANLFHGVAVAVGAGFAVGWRRRSARTPELDTRAHHPVSPRRDTQRCADNGQSTGRRRGRW
ncbi:MAG TPA: rhomboid family intramembrane serine protease [bacterium]|nr:rhomboid family intramembrane serine protease [bacterium]